MEPSPDETKVSNLSDKQSDSNRTGENARVGRWCGLAWRTATDYKSFEPFGCAADKMSRTCALKKIRGSMVIMGQPGPNAHKSMGFIFSGGISDQVLRVYNRFSHDCKYALQLFVKAKPAMDGRGNRRRFEISSTLFIGLDRRRQGRLQLWFAPPHP
jgi:hypothetical protein